MLSTALRFAGPSLQFGARIFVLEDQPNHRDNFIQVLTDQGHDVFAPATLKEALAETQNGDTYDAYLIDGKLHGYADANQRHGHDVAQKMMDQGISPLKMIAISSDSAEIGLLKRVVKNYRMPSFEAKGCFTMDLGVEDELKALLDTFLDKS